MLLRNSPSGTLVNGSRGVVRALVDVSEGMVESAFSHMHAKLRAIETQKFRCM